MKTSMEIDDRLYRAARLRAVREHTTVRALVEEGLRRVLGVAGPSEPDPGLDRSRDLRDLQALCAQVSALPVIEAGTDDDLLTDECDLVNDRIDVFADPCAE
jgi:hypothetical protein